jgi:SanA protein
MLRVAALFGFLLVLLFVPRLAVVARFSRAILSPRDAPPRPVAIVFGAGLHRDGRPTTVLADRVATAATLYTSGKVERLLLSGSGDSQYGNEALAMRQMAVELGVPESAIEIDTQGERTFATCLHARLVYGVRSAPLVTQRYHLPRALAICRGLGIEADGVAADLHRYSARSLTYWQLRELPATLVALWETYLQPSTSAGPPADAQISGRQDPNPDGT